MIDERYILFFGTMVMLFLVLAIVTFVLAYQRKIFKKNVEIQDAQEALNENELNSVYALLQAQQQERKRISRDLHDNVGSVLSTLKMYADELTKTPEVTRVDLIEQVANLSKTANIEVRKVAHSLQEFRKGEFGFSKALDDLQSTVNGLGKVQLEVRGQDNDLVSPELGIELFRIIQELVSNTVKYAKADMASITFTQSDDHLEVMYTDNGVGFDIDKNSTGIGLQNIVERVEKLNGTIKIDTKIGNGSTFHLAFEF